MLTPFFTNQFQKDLEKMKKRGKDTDLIKQVMIGLIRNKKLPKKFKDHKLLGNYKNRRECHIEPDWILIYKIDDSSIIFERTGTHSDLYK